jgi:hypothetical protein
LEVKILIEMEFMTSMMTVLTSQVYQLLMVARTMMETVLKTAKMLVLM